MLNCQIPPFEVSQHAVTYTIITNWLQIML